MSNSFYNHGAFPSTGSAATSASMRAELDLVAAGFDKMPTLAGNANKFVIVNSTGTGLTQTDVLPAFTVTDTDFTVQDDGDNTRKFQFNAGSITTGNTRVYVMPDLDTTLVGTNVTQTLTNKTLTAPVIATIVNTGTLTLPTSTDTLVGRNTTDTLTNKTLTNPVIGTIVNTGTLTLPTSTDTLVGRQTTDTLTNKTISGASNTLSNIANGSLSNSSIVIGSTTLSLGGTMTTLAGVTISGASNTLSNIANASLTNSSITINGSTVALGSSVTVTATATNALTIGNGLSGTSYNGSSAVTIAINTGVTADLSTAQTFSNKTISGSANTLSNIANASLTNSAITIGSTAISLGATSLTIAGLTSASATTLISTGNQATSVAISAIGHSSGTVTVTTGTAHGLTTGDTASIDGVADYTFCGVYTVTVTNANVFTYSQTASGASSSGGFSTKLTGTWGLYAGGTGPSLHNGPVIVSASSQMPALRVTQGGSGYALIVEDAANPDTSAFIISNAGDLAINTNKFTVAAASGNTLVAGTLDATGNFNVNTNKFSVVAASGNTLVAGTLDATGNFNVNTNKFSVVAASGNTTIAGTTSFGGNIVSNLLFTDATYDIGASGANRPRDLFLSRNLTVGGTLTLAGGVNLNGNVTIGDASADTLTVNSTITSNLIFTDNTYDIGASGATRPRSMFLGTNLTVGGLGSFGDNVAVNGAAVTWTGASALTVSDYTAFGQRNLGNADGVVSWNAQWSGGTSGAGYTYRKTGDVASAYEQNGAHRFYTTPTVGTAGGGVSFPVRLAISSAGYTYINYQGTALSNLNILTNGAGGGIQLNRNTSGTNPTAGQSLGQYAWKGTDSANTNNAAEAMIEAVAAENFTGSTAATNLLFYTKASGVGPGSAPTFRGGINYAGQWVIGGGGVSPDGNAKLTLYTGNGTNEGLSIYEISSGSNSRLRLYQASNAVFYDATYSSGGNSHNFQVGSGTVFSINSNVAVLGNSSPLSVFGGNALQGPSFLINQVAGVDQTAYVTGAYQPTYTGSWLARGAYRASMYQQVSGGHAFFTNGVTPAGAGSTVSFAQAVTIDANGFVGINQPSPTTYLEIGGSGEMLRLDGSSGSSRSIYLRNVGVGTATILTDGTLDLRTNAGREVTLSTNSSVRRTVTSGGNMLTNTGRNSNAWTLGNMQEWVGTVANITNGSTFSLFAISTQYDNLAYELSIFVNAGGYFAYKSAGIFGYNGFTNTVLGSSTGLAITMTGTVYNETMTLQNTQGTTVNAYYICVRVWGLAAAQSVSTGGADLVTSSYLTRIA